MLTKLSEFDEKQVVEAARAYLNLHTDGKVPVRDWLTKEVQYVRFTQIDGKWVYSGIVKD